MRHKSSRGRQFRFRSPWKPIGCRFVRFPSIHWPTWAYNHNEPSIIRNCTPFLTQISDICACPTRPDCTIWGHQLLICGICYNVQDHLARSFNILTTTAMVGGTFHIWRHICLVQYAALAGNLADMSIGCFLCQFLVSTTRFWEAHFCSKLVVGGTKTC